MTTYNRYSPYTNDEINDWYLGHFKYPSFVPIADDMEDYVIESKYDRNPWKLAKELYNQERLYWIFSITNPSELVDPLNDFVTGLKIKIPSSDQVNQILRSR